jgi:hypothetical protein
VNGLPTEASDAWQITNFQQTSGNERHTPAKTA